MKAKKTTTLPIGATKNRFGFSFVELMVAVAVLASGIVFIYRIFFISLNYSNHVVYRLHALDLLSQKIETTERIFREKNEIVFGSQQEVKTVLINNRPVDFRYVLDFKSVDGLESLYDLTVSVSWAEGVQKKTLSRSAYIADF
ncbi:MAG: prepilin-type N-terminal cleavage/methylation domain-containing protein [Candidatus Omnitrophota bacterium]